MREFRGFGSDLHGSREGLALSDHLHIQQRAERPNQEGEKVVIVLPLVVDQRPKSKPTPYKQDEQHLNYDMPKDIESYTHRIGRTGRAGRKGTATTLVTGEGIEKEVLHDLKTMLEKCGQKVPNELARHPDCVPADQREFRKKHPKVVEAKK